MRILVTGTDGYLGCLLGPRLLQDGHEVMGVDAGYYRSGWLYNGVKVLVQTSSKDIRQITPEDLKEIDAVVHLSELSNDPLGELVPRATYAINHAGSVRLARLARDHGVKRFVYMSSCSVYGAAEEEEVDEGSHTRPQTHYAKCKLLVERDVSQLASDNFSPTFLRSATAFGASPRMRFDIVLNNLAGLAYTTGQIEMISDGTPWRPLIHALDVGNAIAMVLAAPREVVHGEVFNLGASAQNYTIKEIADIIAEVFPGCTMSFGRLGADKRSYRVSFSKFTEAFPAFRCEWEARRGARQLYELFERVNLTEEMFTSRGYTRLKQLDYLMSSGQVDDELFWKVDAIP